MIYLYIYISIYLYIYTYIYGIRPRHGTDVEVLMARGHLFRDPIGAQKFQDATDDVAYMGRFRWEKRRSSSMSWKNLRKNGKTIGKT